MTREEWRTYCLENGLCISCHKPSDTGKQYCSECARRNRERNAEQREFYLSKGICPVCRKNDLISDEKTCAECKAKRVGRDQKYYAENVLSLNAERRKRRRKMREENRCVNCGRILDASSRQHSTCILCREKRRNDYAKSKSKDRNKRPSKSMCYICGSADLVDGKNICTLCYHRIMKNTKKMWEARRKDDEKS